nr:MAG TPA: hypothetical protein [Caudoviricetes sp.]
MSFYFFILMLRTYLYIGGEIKCKTLRLKLQD